MKIIIKSKFLAFLMSAICFVPSVSQAKIVQNKCITKISEVLKELPANLPQQGSTIAVFDWDETISPYDKILKQAPRVFHEREIGDNGTVAVIRDLQNSGIKTMVLTRRLGGWQLFEQQNKEQLELTIHHMMDLLGEKEWMEHGPFRDTTATQWKLPDAVSLSSEKRPLYIMTMNHFVFAGGNSVKGKALKRLLDLDKEVFIDTPKNIIFIDNDFRNTDDVAETFKDALQNIYIYLYPSPDDPPCPSMK